MVSIPACHTGDPSSIPSKQQLLFEDMFSNPESLKQGGGEPCILRELAGNVLPLFFFLSKKTKRNNIKNFDVA